MCCDLVREAVHERVDLAGIGEPVLFDPRPERADEACDSRDHVVAVGTKVFQICVIKPDGTGFEQLTYQNVQHLTASWSPDGKQILFNELLPPLIPGDVMDYQLFVMNADGSGARQVTFPPGINLIAQWGQLRVHLNP